ncbi:MAG TPA: hypothetical protein PKD26_13110 [Pyrinomonadaceae bacterium]|nr:hypothetical protein [Pyrinomonadaceae bacterium]
MPFTIAGSQLTEIVREDPTAMTRAASSSAVSAISAILQMTSAGRSNSPKLWSERECPTLPCQ